ncbi:MAG: SCP2 sterol-binding domain-containing protein [Pseudomonadota bacterium]|nr:SCP2 sterol-binding domain-containing protein [Pseudomonadota bacterium]
MLSNDSPVLAAVEQALNAAIGQSPSAMNICRGLSGKRLQLHFADLDMDLFLVSHGHNVQVLRRLDQPAQTCLSGSTLALTLMGLTETRPGALFSGEVRISGDVETGQRFQKLLRLAAPDWEALLARVTGDVVAHQVGEGVRGVARWLKQSLKAVGEDLSEYLQYETGEIPDVGELGEFVRDVDQLRDDTERLEARLERIEKTLSENQEADS